MVDILTLNGGDRESLEKPSITPWNRRPSRMGEFDSDRPIVGSKVRGRGFQSVKVSPWDRQTDQKLDREIKSRELGNRVIPQVDVVLRLLLVSVRWESDWLPLLQIGETCLIENQDVDPEN